MSAASRRSLAGFSPAKSEGASSPSAAGASSPIPVRRAAFRAADAGERRGRGVEAGLGVVRIGRKSDRFLLLDWRGRFERLHIEGEWVQAHGNLLGGMTGELLGQTTLTPP